MTSPAEEITNQYDSYLQQGFTESSSQPHRHGSAYGRYVILKKPLGLCEKIGRIVVGTVSTPFAVIGCIGCICCATNKTVDLCQDWSIWSFAEPCDGYVAHEGFIRDEEETKAMYAKDFKKLGMEDYNDQNIVALAKSDKFPVIPSTRYPQHSYITFYGPITRLSYVIVLPDGDANRSLIFIPVGKDKKPLNTAALKMRAETLCGGYMLGVKTIKNKTVRVVDETHIFTSPLFGPIAKGTTFKHKEVIVSS